MASSRVPGSSPTRRDQGHVLGSPRTRTGHAEAAKAENSQGSVRHNLPQIPTMSPQTSRVAVSKSSVKEQAREPGKAFSEQSIPDGVSFASVVPALDAKAPDPLASLTSMVEAKQPGKELEMVLKTPPVNQSPELEKMLTSPPLNKVSPPGSLPTPPSDTSASDTSSSPKGVKAEPDKCSGVPAGIKLRIRRSVHEDGTSRRTSILNLQQNLTTSFEQQHQTLPAAAIAASVQAPHSPATSTGSGERPKVGRTKTKGDIKKQLMEKRGKKRLEGQVQSPASMLEAQDSLPTVSPALAAEKVPLPLAPSKGKPADMSPLDLEFPPKWLVGDLMWSKVPGHPWWPSMVSFDPFVSIYTKIQATGSPGFHKGPPKRQYHVQFFGDEGERGWIPENRMLPFEGEEAFQRYVHEKVVENKKNRGWYEVSARRRKAWMVAVSAATEALPMTRNERKVTFTFTYNIPGLQPKEHQPESGEGVVSLYPTTPDGMEILPNGMVRKKRGRASRGKGQERGESVTPPPKRRRKSSGVGASPLANKSVAQYMVFCQKRGEAIRKENPEVPEEVVEAKLKEQWGQLDDEQRSKFIPMGSDVQRISEMIPAQASRVQRSGRVVKLSQKMMDVDEESDLFQVPSPKKRKRPSLMSPRPAQKPTTSSSSIDEIISSVAAGAGELKRVLDSTVVDSVKEANERDAKVTVSDDGSKRQSEVGELSGQAKKRIKKKKAEAGAVSDDASSTTGSVGPDDLDPKRPAGGDRAEEGLDLEIFKLSSHCPFKKETICRICEQPGELISCEGPCLGHYHLACLGLPRAPTEAFKCDECTSGNHTCFVCKKASQDTRRCSSRDCGRFYHEACIRPYPNTRYENNHFHCPLHLCATCMASNPKNPRVSKGRFFRCVRCPTAYHSGDLCIAAGSLHLAGLNIVCSRHFQPVKSLAHHGHISVSWCFVCSKGGTLLCCETCPASFHAPCLGIDPPEGAFYCQDCAVGKRPLYGSIIWVKLGSYRWWPGEICHPRNVPVNIQEKSHQVGEFPVHFFGSHDFFWTHQGRVFMFQEGDKGSRERSGSKAIMKLFSKGVQEATRAFRAWKEAQTRKECQEHEKTERKPTPYKHIKMNCPIGNVQIYKADPAKTNQCECRPSMECPCSAQTECWNRMLLYECHQSTCPAGERCCNQRFQRREYPKAEPYKTEGRGWGLRALENIKKGQFVNEYVGDLIDEAECRRRLKQYHEDDQSNFYMLTLDRGRVIDAGPKGNLSRFMNHSCSPSCETQKWNVNGDIRVGLFAVRDIAAGEELTFNYNLDCLGNEKKVCHCGAPNCSGFLGVRPKSSTELDKQQKEGKPKKKHRKQGDRKRPPKKHEDDCYRCGDGGELVMCDKGHCPKVYHLKCLKLSKPPVGSWICPWHHCDVCGKKALKLCSECPNSFCHEHIEKNIFLVPENKLVCHEHQDILSVIESSRLELLQNEAEGAKSGTSSSSEVTTSSAESSPGHSDSESDMTPHEEDPKLAVSLATPEVAPVNGKGEARPSPSDTESSSTEVSANTLPPKKRRSRSQVPKRKSEAKDGSRSGSQSTEASDAEAEKALRQNLCAATSSTTNSGAVADIDGSASVSSPVKSKTPTPKAKNRRKLSSVNQPGDRSTQGEAAKDEDSKAPHAMDKEKSDDKVPASPTKKTRKSSGGSKLATASEMPKPTDSIAEAKCPESRQKRVNSGKKSDADKTTTPRTKSSGRRSSKNGTARCNGAKNGTNNNQGESKRDTPMFDDNDSDEFPDLVIDIPNI